MTIHVLVLFDSRGRLIGPLAQGVAEGVARVPGARAVLRTVDEASRQDLDRCDALVLGSPNWSGVTAPPCGVKLWLDSLGDLWEDASLAGKVGAAFTGGASRSAGIEFTLLTLIHWMLANGLIVVGLPPQLRCTAVPVHGTARARRGTAGWRPPARTTARQAPAW